MRYPLANYGHIVQDEQKKEPLEVMKSLVPPPPPPPSVTETSDDTVGNTNGEELMEVERKLQREEESYAMYNRIYM